MVMLTARARTPAAPPPRPSADDSRSSDLLTYMLINRRAMVTRAADAAASGVRGRHNRRALAWFSEAISDPKRLFLVQERARQDGLQGFDVVGSVGWGC